MSDQEITLAASHHRKPVKPFPLSVRLIATSNIIVGILALLCGLVNFASADSSHSKYSKYWNELQNEIPSYAMALGAESIVTLVLGAVCLVAGLGLLGRWRWAAWLAITYGILMIVWKSLWLSYALFIVQPVFRHPTPQLLEAMGQGISQESLTALLTKLTVFSSFFILHAAFCVIVMIVNMRIQITPKAE